MIQKIEKDITDNKLTVTVFCLQRKFASHKIKLLTTEKVYDILIKEYKIINTIKEPNHKVGNSCSQKIQLSGVWEFELEQENKSKPKTTRKEKQKTNKNTSSIRSRMSKLASTKREEVATESPTE